MNIIKPINYKWMIFRWTIILSLLVAIMLFMTQMPGSSYSGPFQSLNEAEQKVHDRLVDHVNALALEIGERNVWRHPRLMASAGYIEDSLTELGYAVNRQEFEVHNVLVANIEAELSPINQTDKIIVVGAHYDTVLGSPGANDNGTGVAALLELARLLHGQHFTRTVRLVAFVNEEPPFFLTKDMGSRRYAMRSRRRGEKITAMLSLETIGYYSDQKGSQNYPFPFGLFYPDTANFIAFVGNMGSRRLVRQSIKSFRKHTKFPSEGTAAPGWLAGIGWSDHWSFWKEGYPAIMITDTALFRYDHYHTAMDMPSAIDYTRMARVVYGLSQVVADLATER
ncbi:MAG: M28 family peptidase [Desulfobulbaceae bacterium]|nr:M28 family peptidase [Desulfobulbaceae bacterium]